jgi:hypothetical protein
LSAGIFFTKSLISERLAGCAESEGEGGMWVAGSIMRKCVNLMTVVRIALSYLFIERNVRFVLKNKSSVEMYEFA